MQTDNGISQKKPDLPIIEIDDFDMDGLGFKPINQGLGFHGERETKTRKNTSQIKHKESSFSQISTRESRLNHVSENMPLPSPMQGIEHFYVSEKKEIERLEKEITQNNVIDLVEAKLLSRLCAFIVDCGVVFTTSLFVFGLFVLTLYSAVGRSLIQNFVFENLDFFLILNSVVYIIYFTLWDGVGTLGKVLMNIEVRSSKKDNVLSMTQLFNRCVISFFGIFLFFIPNILDAHSKLSRTKTVETK